MVRLSHKVIMLNVLIDCFHSGMLAMILLMRLDKTDGFQPIHRISWPCNYHHCPQARRAGAVVATDKKVTTGLNKAHQGP